MKKEEVQKRRDKLIEQFQLMIQDEQKMDQLEEFFFNLLQDGNSKLSTKQWQIVEERDEAYNSGKQTGSSWEEVKKEIRSNKNLSLV